MNVERMRRQSARARAQVARLDYRAKLARMTPAHRAKHERTDRWGGACLECMSLAWARTNTWTGP